MNPRQRVVRNAIAAPLAALSAALALRAVPLAAQPSAPGARAAQPAESSELSGLRAAFLSGAPDELTRAGQRLSANRLAVALGRADRELVLAAAGAAPSVPDAIWLLAPLAELSRSPDRPLAAAAARSAARIAGALDLDQLLERDVPLDWVRARLAEYRAQAADAGRWTDVRVASLEAAAHLGRALADGATPPDRRYDLRALLADPEPEMRRAALELAFGPLDPAEIEAVAARAQADEDPAVAAAAAQTLCEGIDVGDDAEAVLDALGGRGLARVREVVTDGDQPMAARAGAARCLMADDSSASRAAVEEMRDGDEDGGDRVDEDGEGGGGEGEGEGGEADGSESKRDKDREPRGHKRKEAK